MYNPEKPYKKEIIKLIESTWRTPHLNMKKGIYPVMAKKFSLPEVQHTDGIGTKGIYHWRKRSFKNAVLDALAMNLNDLAMVGAVPYAIQNHIVLPADDHKAVLDIVRVLADECKKRKIALTGGETSIHNDVKGLDISITVCGFVPYGLKNQCMPEDVLIGLKSNGLHSNGFTKVREVFGKKHNKEFIKPTKIYIDEVSLALKKIKINGMMHITGGAFAKLKDILADGDAIIDHPEALRPQKIFQDMYSKGASNRTMYSTFNCGIGFILSVPGNEAKKALSCFKDSAVIGRITKGKGKVRVKSAFDQKLVKL